MTFREKFNKFTDRCLGFINNKVVQIILGVGLLLKLLPLRMFDIHLHAIYQPVRILVLAFDVFIAILMLVLITKSDWFLYRIFFPLFYYVLFLILSTALISNGDIGKCLFESAQLISSISIFFLLSATTKENRVYKIVLFCFIGVLLCANLVFHILNKNAISVVENAKSSGAFYLFDQANNTPNIIFAYLFIIILLGYSERKLLIPSIVLCGVFLSEIVFYDYSTGKMGLILFILFAILSFIKKGFILKAVPLWVYGLVPIILFLMITVFRLQNYLDFIIVDVLGEDLTLHGRTSIWDTSMKLISSNFWTGMGYDKAEYMYSPIFHVLGRHSHSHSEYLEILLHTGLFGFLSFISLFATFFSSSKKTERKEVIFCASSIFILLIMAISETVLADSTLIFIGLALSLISPKKEAIEQK